MGGLELHYSPPNLPADPDGALLVARIYNEEMELVKEEVLGPRDQPVKASVEPGRYHIRITQPSGQSYSMLTNVSEDKFEPIYLNKTSSPSPHEWLSYQTGLGALGGGPWLAEKAAFARIAAEAAHLGVRGVEGPKEQLWCRLWNYQDGEAWKLGSLKGAIQDHAVDFSKLRLASASKPRYIQCGNANLSWQLVALPPGRDVDVVMTRTSPVGAIEEIARTSPGRSKEPAAGLRVVVTSLDTAAESLLRSLNSPRSNTSQLLLEHLEKNGPLAEQLLRSKFTYPIGAVVGGYVLLRAQEYHRLHDWPENLAKSFTWLPDGPVIYAWQRLGDQERRNPTLAREQLLEAAKRGLPLFTEGVRLLQEGLEYFARFHKWQRGKRPYEGSQDSEVDKAWRRVLTFAAASDPAAPHTTFRGEDPDTPTLTPKVNTPKKPTGTWLAMPLPE
jgi:hypothetical protein